MSGSHQPQKQGSSSPSSSSRRRPERPSLSCTECRRRKQKCNQGKPCTNCSRRFPQPICEYDTKVTKRRSKKTGTRTAEDPASALTDQHGPYSHLKQTGIQDVILQVELPTRPRQQSTARDRNWEVSTPSTPDSVIDDSGESWRPFRLGNLDEQDAVAARTIREAVRRAIRLRGDIKRSSSAKGWNLSPAHIIKAAEEAVPPPKAILSSLEDHRHLPMAPTRLNKELLRTHLQLISRFKVSVFGEPSPDNPFMRHWVPYTVQHPLGLQALLYTSACFLKETGHVSKTLTMAYKSSVYQMLNTALRNEKTQCEDSTVLTITQLIIDEWLWGATTDLQAHMHGLQMVVRLRGGLQNLGMHGFLAKLVLLNDVVMAICHETDPFIFEQPGFEFTDPVMVPFQTALNTPFVSGWPTFASSSLSSQLNPLAAIILDDMRIMIETVINGLDENLNHTDPEKLLATITWAQSRLDSLPTEIIEPSDQTYQDTPDGKTSSNSPATESLGSNTSSPAEQAARDHGPGAPDAVYGMIRRTAYVYYRAITHRKPLSVVCTDEDFNTLWVLCWYVQRSKLNMSVGVLLWAVTAISPTCLVKPPARFVKTITMCALMQMGVDNWHVATDAARRVLKLQAWLRSGVSRGMVFYGGEAILDKHGFVAVDTLPEIGLTPHYEEVLSDYEGD